MELVEFLEARIAEDEAAARAVVDEHEMWDWDSYMSSAGWYDGSAHKFAQRNDPARVLAECDAKRRIVEAHPLGEGYDLTWDYNRVVGCLRCTDSSAAGEEIVSEGPCLTLRLLAAVYADHPDYDPEWKL